MDQLSLVPSARRQLMQNAWRNAVGACAMGSSATGTLIAMLAGSTGRRLRLAQGLAGNVRQAWKLCRGSCGMLTMPLKEGFRFPDASSKEYKDELDAVIRSQRLERYAHLSDRRLERVVQFVRDSSRAWQVEGVAPSYLKDKYFDIWAH